MAEKFRKGTVKGKSTNGEGTATKGRGERQREGNGSGGAAGLSEAGKEYQSKVCLLHLNLN